MAGCVHIKDPAFVRMAPAQFALREFQPDMSEPDLQPKIWIISSTHITLNPKP